MREAAQSVKFPRWLRAGCACSFCGLLAVLLWSDHWLKEPPAQLERLAQIGCFVAAFAWTSCAFPAARWIRFACQMSILLATLGLYAGQRRGEPVLSDGFVINHFAAFPEVTQPSSLCVDHRNRLFVAEAHSFAFQDLTGYEEQVASRTVHSAHQLACSDEVSWRQSDRVRRLQDTDRDGTADRIETVVDGFPLQDGVACGVAVRGDRLWLGNTPKLWRFQDADGRGAFERREVLHAGFGVRRKFRGHGIHGLTFGPDGKLYFSTGDRGLQIETKTGHTLYEPDSGCVLRCNPDGSELEIFATGLRNPYDLAFDKYGNLWTADNDSNFGDKSRWVYVVEGGDSGWRVGYQPLPAAGPFNSERIWDPRQDIPARVPAVGCVGIGPAGVAYYPGTGLPRRFDNHFLLCDHAGVVLAVAVEPAGAGYRLSHVQEFLFLAAPTDVAFGTDGSVYIAAWGSTDYSPDQSHILRARHPRASQEPVVAQVQALLSEGLSQRSDAQLLDLLGHQDLRVRQQAQFELAARGPSGALTLQRGLQPARSQLTRIHALWGLGQIGAAAPAALDEGVALLRDRDAEIRAQAAKVLGDRRHESAFRELVARLGDPHPRVRYFAVQGLGKFARAEAGPAILEMLRLANPDDPFLRHAAATALARLGDLDLLRRAAVDTSPKVRLAALLALRRLRSREIAGFLDDRDPLLRLAAVRAIHDAPIDDCLPELAELLHRPGLSETIWRRVINAHYRLGTAASAQLLVDFAGRGDVAPAARSDALGALAEWPLNTNRDRLLGCWRPSTLRASGAARMALSQDLEALLSDPVPEVALAAHAASEALGIGISDEVLAQRLFDSTLPSQLRADSLQRLVERKAAAAVDALDFAWKSGDPILRLQAVQAAPAIDDPDTAGLLHELALSSEPLPLRQAAVAALGSCRCAAAEAALAELVEAVADGGGWPELHLELAEAVSQRESAELSDRLLSLALRSQAETGLGEHWVSLHGGDPSRGRAIFWHHPAAQCVRCHDLSGSESRLGPSLARAGRQPRRNLLVSLLQPNAAIVPGYGQTTLQLVDGTTATGIVETMSPSGIRLWMPSGRYRDYPSQQIEDRSPPKSAMPNDFGDKLSKRELRDLVAFLAAQGTQTPQGRKHE